MGVKLSADVPPQEVRMIKECSEERYDELLGVLPPALWLANRFLVGEPYDHRRCKITKQVMPTIVLDTVG